MLKEVLVIGAIFIALGMLMAFIEWFATTIFATVLAIILAIAIFFALGYLAIQIVKSDNK